MTGEEGFYMDDRAVLAWDSPFDELLTVSDTGHINAMADKDSILRHAMLYVDVPGLGRVYSFSRVLYEKYAAARGIQENPLPTTVDDGFFYIPFTGGPRSYYDSVSIVDLVDGAIDPGYFAGKVVLIGPYAAGMQDEYRTSIDHAAPMYGIEIQANLIDAYRAGFYPREASEALQLVLLFLVSGLCFWWLWDRKMLHALLTWLALCVSWIAICFGLYRLGS